MDALRIWCIMQRRRPPPFRLRQAGLWPCCGSERLLDRGAPHDDRAVVAVNQSVLVAPLGLTASRQMEDQSFRAGTARVGHFDEPHKREQAEPPASNRFLARVRGSGQCHIPQFRAAGVVDQLWRLLCSKQIRQNLSLVHYLPKYDHVSLDFNPTWL